MSGVISDAMVQQAVELALPSIRFAMEKKVASRADLHIVVSTRPQPDAGWSTRYEYSMGEQSTWEWPYDKIARAKDEITRRTGRTSREVQLYSPWLLLRGDIKYWGNATIDGVIIVSCSGAQSYMDEVFANIIMQFLLGLIQKRIEEELTGTGKNDYYL